MAGATDWWWHWMNLVIGHTMPRKYKPIFSQYRILPISMPFLWFLSTESGGKKKKKSPKPGLLMKFEFMSKSPSSLFYHCFIWKNKNLILFMMYTFGLVKLYFSSKQTAFCRWLNSIWFMVEVNYLLLRYSTRTEAAWYGHLHCSICRGV